MFFSADLDRRFGGLARLYGEAEAIIGRALKAITECHQALIRATDETELLDEVCRIIVEVGGYRMAWVGYAEVDAHKSVRPVAQTGFDEGYVEQLNLTWADNSNNETSFEVWRSTDGGSIFTLRASTVANATSYQDTLVNSSAQYYYRVRADNGVAFSAWSNTATVTTGAVT